MIHVVPFLAGAAAGAAVTYLVQSPASKEKIKAGAEKVSEGVKAGVGKAKSVMSGKKETAEASAEETPTAESPA